MDTSELFLRTHLRHIAVVNYVGLEFSAKYFHYTFKTREANIEDKIYLRIVAIG